MNGILFLEVNLMKNLTFLALSLFLVTAKAQSSAIKIETFENQILDLYTDSGNSGIIGILKPSDKMQRWDLMISQNDESTQYFGICFSNLESCSSSSSIRDIVVEQSKLAVGRSKLQPALLEQFHQIPNMRVDTKTTILKIENDSITISFEYKMDNLPTQIKKIVLKRNSSFSNTKFNFVKIDKDISNRRSIGEVSENLKAISSNVFKIHLDDSSEESLLGGGEGHGTGFFISHDGLALTNNHVIEGAKECLKKLKCKLKISHVTADGKLEEDFVTVNLLATHKGYDFALIKLEFPESYNSHSFFKIEKNEVTSDLFSLGFPGDRGNHAGGPLTYSFGKLIGIMKQTFVSSVYINGGASGSPMLSTKTGNLVGILSNGVGTEDKQGEGLPSLIRPIYLINSTFGLDNYISGIKQKIVQQLIETIKSSNNQELVKTSLNSLYKERTLLGVNELMQLMISHPDNLIRSEIFDYLQRINFLGVR
jgi:S1-C subfamily serine protease